MLSGEITSMVLDLGPDEGESGFVQYVRRGPNGGVGVVSVHGTIGSGVDWLDVEQAIDRGIEDGGSLMLKINSRGGVVDDVIHQLTDAIAQARARGVEVVAYIDHAFGSAYFLAAECSPVFIDPRGRVGNVQIQPGCGNWQKSIAQRLEKHCFERIRERRPCVTWPMLQRLRTSFVSADWAEATGLVDVIVPWGGLISDTGCGRC